MASLKRYRWLNISEPQACLTWRLGTGYHTRWRGLEPHLLLSARSHLGTDLLCLLLSSLIIKSLRIRGYSNSPEIILNQEGQQKGAKLFAVELG